MTDILRKTMLAISVLPILLILAGCVTMSAGSEEGATLIERSKEQAPAWVEVEAGRLHKSERHYEYVEVRTQLLNLSVGLKESQLGALTASEHELRDNVRHKLFAHARDNGIAMTGPMAELDVLLAKAIREVHGRHAKVADIYFERYRRDQPTAGPAEYFKTFILVQFPTTRYGEFFTEVGRSLQSSRDVNLKRLGQAVGQMSASQDLSH